jgi:hypothetical protein
VPSLKPLPRWTIYREASSNQFPRLTHSGGATAVASSARATPVVFGGKTAQDWPVVIRISANGKQVVSALAAIDMESADDDWVVPDGFQNLPVKAGRFGWTWGPEQLDLDDGQVAEASGSISGKFSRNRTKVSGTWRRKAVVKDSTGAIVATYDSQRVAWSATQ